ncbi:MAG: CBS domain-containing protein [Lachnospiraceae bacterium]|nr:CBS domain-containing protein [Lachnospiraceae bacterium]
MQIEEFIVYSETSIIETMNKIDKNSRRIVYVVDENRILLGAITDGDIRRYILKNGTINGLAMDVMNKEPKSLKKKNVHKAAELMKKYSITSMPVINDKGYLDYIEFDDGKKFYDTENLNVPVVIMAGGKGTRLYPYTQILPKPLIPIGEKTITEHIMDHFEVFGCEKFTMIVNYKKEFIKAFFRENENQRNVDFVDETIFSGTAGGLKLIKDKVKSTFFMSNCDILIEDNYSEIFRYHKENRNIITLVCALKKEIIPYGTIVTDETGKIKKLTEKPEFEFLTNTGFYVIEPEFLDEIPDNTFIHITDVIQSCIDKNMRVGVYPVNENAWMDMGQMKELEKMRKKVEK